MHRASILLALSILAASLVLPAVAVAQDAPEFGTWGPGMSAPSQEGVDSTPSPSGSPDSSSAPYAPYAAPPSAAPPPTGGGGSGCSYDLRGSWQNRGRYTTGGNYSYSQGVSVRQYVGGWIYGQQDDGTAYYGRCIGSQVRFDVYYYGQYVGRQTGSVSGIYAAYPYSYEPPSSSAAPYFAPAPPGGGYLSASFSWRNAWGAGYETWSK